MSVTVRIMDVHAREILDSRGNPTVEAEVTVIAGEGAFGGPCINGRNMEAAAGNHKEKIGDHTVPAPVGAPFLSSLRQTLYRQGIRSFRRQHRQV